MTSPNTPEMICSNTSIILIINRNKVFMKSYIMKSYLCK